MQNVFKFLFHVVSGRFRLAFEMLTELQLGTKVAFVGIGFCSYIIQQYPTELYTVGERSYYMTVLAVTGNDRRIKLSRGGRSHLDSLIKNLKNDHTVELMRRNLGVVQGYNTWAVAQTVVALGRPLPVKSATLKTFFEGRIDEKCNCWRETPEKQPHTGATGWALFAMSKLGLKAPYGVLDFLLTLQSPDGWWPLHPAKIEPKSASSYATAWATLALCSQLPLQKSANAANTGQISFAIKNALNWLAKNEISNAARWLDYPANKPNLQSVSISGLIVHVKKICGDHNDIDELHRRWLNALPSEIISASTEEASNAYITLNNDALEFDRTRHYPLQWAMVATVDAYAAGTLVQRAAALQWIERILKPGLASPEVRNRNWVSAELLYALRYLQAHLERSGQSAR